MKRRAIFVDNFIPSPDKDAGSKSTYQYMMLFLEMGFEIVFIANKKQDNDECYLDNLNRKGISILRGCNDAQWESGIKNFISDDSIVFINRINNLKKFGPFIRQNTGAKILYYGHDLMSLRKFRQFRCEHKMFDLAKAIQWKIAERKYHVLPDAVYYPSSAEAQMISRRNKDINVRRINLFYADSAVSSIPESGFAARKGIVFVGGFRHKPNIDGMLWFMKKVYPHIKSNIIVHIVGSNTPLEIKGLGSDKIIIHGFLSEAQLDALYKSCRLAIVPLRYGAGVKGKLVEAMFYGLPIVTTTIGAEGIDELENIIPVIDNPEKFAESIDALYNSPETLSHVSEKISRYINRNFSKEAAIEIIKQDL